MLLNDSVWARENVQLESIRLDTEAKRDARKASCKTPTALVAEVGVEAAGLHKERKEEY